MNGQDDLNTIRSLIERREIYRKVFARVALFTGALSILAASAIYWNDEVRQFLGRPIRPREFAFVWLVIFALTTAATGLFAARNRDSGDHLGMARTQMVLNAVAPYVLIAAAFTVWFLGTGYLGAAELELVIVWIACYGLMLHAIGLLASRSIAILGWAFLLTGVAAPILSNKIDNWTDNVSVTLMGVTFGLYHIIFAALNRRANQPKRS